MISTFVIKPTERTFISGGPCVVLNSNPNILINFSTEDGTVFKTTGHCNRPEYLRHQDNIYAQSEGKATNCKVSGIVCHCGETVELKYLWGSKPYPILMDTDAYTTTVKPLDVVLQKAQMFDESYAPIIKPLDMTLRSILRDFNIDYKDTYTSTIKPLDITLKRILRDFSVDDKGVYTTTIKPLDITLQRVLIEQYTDDLDVYTVTIKPLDITLTTGT